MMGAMLGLEGLRLAAVLGGIGSIPGAMVGGLVIGVVESLTKAYIGTITGGVITSAFSDAIVFGILIIVLLGQAVRPDGRTGEPSRCDLMKKSMLSTKQSYRMCAVGIVVLFGILMGVCECTSAWPAPTSRAS